MPSQAASKLSKSYLNNVNSACNSNSSINTISIPITMTSTLDHLNHYYESVQDIILSRQNGCSGLIPASTAVTGHGDYRDAWVRDNVYSTLAVFGLYLAYSRVDDDSGRAFELEHSVIKCMRGLLFCMMRQVHKVEVFKNTQAPGDALHAKYNTATGDTVVADNAWGHLQLDATSLFILALAQMTSAGLQIIFTQDEVDFVQNLVFYIERSYRTPDFGVWERGNKMNHGLPELNSSSIGMATAALQAINRVNLFGTRGGPLSIIHVLPDELARNYTTLLSCLPRESHSKEVDAALLSVISYPAFAICNQDLINQTRMEIISKLEGRYGCKRFLRDGHQTVLEDTSRLHYEPHELNVFEHIECEWPLFFTYLILDGIFRDDAKSVEKYRELLDSVVVIERNVLGGHDPFGPRKLVPELYIVPKDKVEAEKKDPHSQERIPNANVPLLWAQSLYILGSLIQDGLLDPNEIDPLGLHKRSKYKSNTDTVVQIVLLSESDALKAKLLEWGVESQTLDDVAPYFIASPVALRDAFGALGLNKKLGLSGRPKRPIGTLSTCKGYRFNGRTFFFIPHFMDMEEFYMTSDNNYLISLFEHELIFIKNNWSGVGRPTMCLLVKKQMISSANRDKASLLDFFVSLRSGSFKSMRVRLGRLQEMATTSCIESLDFLTEKLSAGEIKRQFMDPLKGSPTSAASSHLNEFMLLGIRKRVKSYRIDAGKSPSPSTSAQDSPLDTHIITLPKKSPFKLKEPEDSSKRRTTSPQPILRGRSDSNASINALTSSLKDASLNSSDQDMKHFTLYDSTNIQEAIEILKESANLYEQLDLLHYLHTCNGLDYETGISTVQVLLEEVYVKACSISLWSIVRRSAALLMKVVNSLSINLIDLLIQQKQVSIGYGDGEKFINEPIPPEKLREIIYDRSRFHEDIADPSLVQEILTYLGSFVRAEPKLYDGILRIRIHHLIITLRDEIALQKGYSESEAYMHLISLSPSELKNMLKALLQGSLNPLEPAVRPVVALNEMQDFETLWFAKVTEVIHISVESAGYNDGNFCMIRIEGNTSFSMRGERGINIVVVESKDGTIKRQVTFDTHSSEEESEDLVKFIQYIGEHDIIIFSICDDASERLSSKARDALKMLGSEKVETLGYRDSWAMITRKTNRKSFVVEGYKKAGTGKVQTQSKSVNLLVAKDTTIVPAFGPSKSLYLHKRRINGALNRVPHKFYPRVWNILARCKGLHIGPNLLPRDPTVSEKTPEEFNFALQVEHHLEAIQDPAERHMVVECLMILSKIQDRNPEIDLRSQIININKILKEAVIMFWNYMKKNENFKRIVMHLCGWDEGEGSLGLTNKNDSIEDDVYRKSWGIMANIFYDLPAEGVESTSSFITRSAIQNMSFRIESSSDCVQS